MRRWVPILLAGLAGGSAVDLFAADVGLIKINGAIGPATATYISRALDVAGRRNYACLIIQLDTPGGLLETTKEITQTFYASKVPTVVYVAPSGASATSAGCFITLAADVAAMAPHTSIGAAHPVSIGFGSGESTNGIMTQKSENFAAGLIEAIAEKRGRNVEWAKSSVRESAAITAEKALELKVIDLIADSLPDLLKQLDGRDVNGQKLKTADSVSVEIPMSFPEKALQLLARPDIYAPTHGVLTFGGIVSFFFGLLMLFNRAEPGFRLSLAYVIPATLLTAFFFIFVAGAGLRAQSLPVRAGRETMLGKTVAALGRIDARSGKVFVEGEYWNAISDSPIETGQPAEIVGIQGLTLKVRPKQT